MPQDHCLKLVFQQIMKDAAVAVPRAYCHRKKSEWRLFRAAHPHRQIVEQAQQQGSLNVAISGLNSIRQTLDSLARLAGHLQPASTQVNVAVQTNINVGARQIAERLIQKFDREPELKAQIAQALVEVDDEQVP